MKNIIVTEDHDLIRNGLVQYLTLSGFNAVGCSNLSETRRMLSDSRPDLLILDVMLPDGDGFLFAKETKKKYGDLHLFFCTARVDESDRILGFELGCDDYITKPFSPKELILRVEALFRRLDSGKAGEADRMEFTLGQDKLLYDRRGHRILVNETEVPITASEWKIVSYLIENSPNLISRSQILSECFDYHYDSYDRLVDTHIKNIRNKLGNMGWIDTVRGYGYKFAGKKVT